MLSSWFHRSKHGGENFANQNDLEKLTQHPAFSKKQLSTNAIKHCHHLEHQLQQKGLQATDFANYQAKAIHQQMHQKPVLFLAASAAIGLLLGLLISRK